MPRTQNPINTASLHDIADARYQRHHELILLTQEYTDAVATRMKGWQLFVYSEKPRPTLKMLVDPKGKAVLTVQRTPDGTVNAQGRDGALNTVEETHTSDWSKELYRALENRAIEALLEEAGERCDRRSMPAEAVFHWQSASGYHKQLKQTARRLAMEALSTATENGATTEAPRDRLARRMLHLLRTRIFDPETTELAEKWCGWRNTRLKAHNHVALNLSAYRRMAQEAPKVLEAHSIICAKPRTPRKLSGPGEITHKVQGALRLSKRAWRNLCLLGLPEDQGGNRNLVRATRVAHEALAEANRPTAPESAAKQVLSMGEFHERFTGRTWSHGDPKNAWTRVLNRMLAHAETTEGIPLIHRTQQLYHVGDALDAQIEADLPWGPGGWEDYIARADRWSEATGRPPKPANIERLAADRWECPEAPPLSSGFTAQPLRNALEMARTGQEMENCIASYTSRCRSKDIEIYVIRNAEGEATAAAELRAGARGWRLGQVEAPNHQGPSAEARKAATAILEHRNNLPEE